MTIMNTKVLLLTGLILVLFSSCKKFLDPYPKGNITSEDLWTYQEGVQGLVGRCYDYMATNYNDNEGAYLDGATDDAEVTNSIYSMHRLAIGTLISSQDPFLTYWNRDYKSIYLVNLFLKDRRGFNTPFLTDAHLNGVLRSQLQGEAFALRAWFEWDLLQKFGGKGINGQMLGFPIITTPLDPTGDINFARNTYDECVKQIIDDCDSAYKYLPIAHRNFLYPENSPDLVYAGGKLWGRMDGITTRAIKANVYLTWASPRFNPNNDLSRWDSAAVNAKTVMNFKLTKDNVTNGFNPVAGVNWFNPNFPGIVISSRYVTAVSDMEAMERLFYPGGFQGYGAIGATQELVNSFPMANGYPINDPANRGNYDPAKPYTGRDPRFYSTIFYNTSLAKVNNTGATMYTFENWINGGKDAAGINSSNSLTNYHIKKFVFMGLNWTDASPNRQPHSKFFIRWEHMCLAFAEAANHVVGPTNAAKYGMSPETAIQYLRAKNTSDNANGISPVVPGAPDAYLAEVAAAGQAAFDILVKNERRIETCFEGMRFFDLRRWTTDLTELNKNVHGTYITQKADLSFTYNLNYQVDKRSYSSAYLPIPYTEILKMSKLVQNEGWNGWN
jgi:starch-binding outer membrane protein, SusD/RagB family